MRKTHVMGPFTAVILALISTAAAQATVGIRVIIENRAPDGGTWFTPVWVGFHDGSFDTYDLQGIARWFVFESRHVQLLCPVAKGVVLRLC